MSHRILIVGAGFAGMWSALSAARLRRQARAEDALEIAVIAPEPFLHVRPRFYEADLAGMKAPLADLFATAGTRFVPGTVERIQTGDSTVEYAAPGNGHAALSYDRLVLAAGSRLYRPDIPGLAEYGFNVDQWDDAAILDAHLRELARLPDSPARNTVVVAGGGFTGIETAAEMPARLRTVLGEAADVRVVMVEQASEIGPDLGPGPRPAIKQALGALGITWQVNAAVTAVDSGGVWTSRGERIEANTVIWTAGVRASPLTQQVPGERDRLGRLRVDRDLRVVAVENVFATGDTAFAATDELGNHALMSCQHAIALGRAAGHNAAADLLGLPSFPYSQPKYVTCLDLGAWGAVYTEGWDRQVRLKGEEAKRLKRTINTQWIYPPRADWAELSALADPAQLVVA